MRFDHILRRATGRLHREWVNTSLIGTSLVGYHVAKLSGRKTRLVNMRGVGPVAIRPRESDLSTFRQIFYGEEYRPPVAQVEHLLRTTYERTLAEGFVPIIVDAGANVGAATLWMKAQYPQAHVVAIEPDPASSELLRQNTKGLERVTT